MKNPVLTYTKSGAFRSRIHHLIPGGAHTYSKGDDQFPQLAPAAIQRGKGAHVWDIDGNRFLDCSMGLTSVSLGHAYEPVLSRVREELENGVNFQRPSLLELETAEKFLSLVPGHDMIKFAKNGSTVTTAAVKLARAKTGRTLVAFPSNHPFYSYDDWFIATTPCTKGVPSETAMHSVTFNACDIGSLRALFARYPGQIACVITEPEKSTCGPNCCAPDSVCGGKPAQFLRSAVELAHADGALFILDEMITGFKTALPGSITKYQIDADMATWGKGIANGFSFCALTGKRAVMELGGINRPGEEKVFLISTTHGGETHAMAAAIATIDTFQRHDVVAHNQALGQRLIEACQDEVRRHDLQAYVQVLPCPWMATFVFRNKQGQPDAGYRTLFLQEMIRRGVLFQGVFVPCFSHTPEDVADFARAFAGSLEVYQKALGQGYEAFLVGEPTKPVFRKKI